MPFIMRLYVSGMFGGPEEVVILAQTMLYPLDMGAIGMLVGSMHVLFLKQARTRTPWEDYKHIASDSVTAFILGFGFLIMAFIPTDMTLAQLVPIGFPATIGNIPAQFGIWLIVAIVGTLAYVVVELALRRMQS